MGKRTTFRFLFFVLDLQINASQSSALSSMSRYCSNHPLLADISSFFHIPLKDIQVSPACTQFQGLAEKWLVILELALNKEFWENTSKYIDGI